jgi:MFS family permease
MYVFSFDQAAVAVALPSMASSLHGLARLPFVVASFLIAVASSTVAWSRAGEEFGRRRVHVAALVAMCVASIGAATATTMWLLISWRFIQGLGVGGLIASSQAIIVDVAPIETRGRYLRLFGVTFGVALFTGPVLGGWLTQSISWRWIFVIDAALGAAALVAVLAALHVPLRRAPRRLDLGGALLLAVSIALITVSLARLAVGATGESIILGIAALLALGALVTVERLAAEPMFPRGLWRHRQPRLLAALAFIIGTGVLGVFCFVPYFLQGVRGRSPVGSALLMLAVVVGMIVTFNASRIIMFRTGRYKALIVAGMALESVALWTLSRVGAATPDAAVLVGLVMFGLGVGLVLQVLVVAMQAAAPSGQADAAAAGETVARMIGGAVGTVGLGAVLIRGYGPHYPTDLAGIERGHLASAFHQALGVGAAIALLGAIVGLAVREQRAETPENIGFSSDVTAA